ncbi:MAG TPA: pyruvate kinase [Bacilli bacterium]|nr:pyruvate kinase [Bacilli bacterium]HPZ23722.1 pyruvate kinase [Bacilli bacterium]HQC83637.1 pyruvate kinase [Bacilli bacterium]
MKKTKIVTSIGPASNTVEVFKKMVLAGANVARINFSHATIEERETAVATVKAVRKELNTSIGILYDTKGPEFRNGEVVEEGIDLIAGNTIKVVKDSVVGNQERFSLNHPEAIDALNVGDIILLENGLMSIKVTEKNNDELTCTVINGGKLFSRKSLAAPGVDLNIPFISDIDREDIIYACRHEGDFLAASFVQSAADVLAIREILKEENREDMKIIAKIESQMGINNLDEIVKVADGCMVARGDLGVEVPMANLPIYQKRIVKACRQNRKLCIVATEMLESMKHNPRPTRAEVTDVANAVYNGTDAVMLSGETTTGDYPVETVRSMAEIAENIENAIIYKNIFADPIVTNATDAVIKSVADAANSLNTKLIVVPTMSGTSAKLISNLEPKCPILALVSDDNTANQLILHYGVYTKVVNYWNDLDEIMAQSLEEAKKFINLVPGDNIIITGGFSADKNKNEVVPTNLMKIETIK